MSEKITKLIEDVKTLSVLELNSLVNCIIFTPCGPKAVPTGGAGVALPAGICNLTIAITFFAIFLAPPYKIVVNRVKPSHLETKISIKKLVIALIN